MKKAKERKSGLLEVEEGYEIYAEDYVDTEKFLDTFDKDALMSYLKNYKGKKILDVGAGTGRTLELLLKGDNEVVALDSSEKMLQQLKKKNKNVETVVGDAEELPFKDQSFDVVVATFLIVHLKRLDKFFEEAYRVLKEGGVLIVTNVNQRKPPKLTTKLKKNFYIKSFYHRPDNVVKELEKAFFTVESDDLVERDNVWILQIVKAVK